MSDELVQQWVNKAEEDWTGIVRLRSGSLEGIANIVAFLAQREKTGSGGQCFSGRTTGE